MPAGRFILVAILLLGSQSAPGDDQRPATEPPVGTGDDPLAVRENVRRSVGPMIEALRKRDTAGAIVHANAAYPWVQLALDKMAPGDPEFVRAGVEISCVYSMSRLEKHEFKESEAWAEHAARLGERAMEPGDRLRVLAVLQPGVVAFCREGGTYAKGEEIVQGARVALYRIEAARSRGDARGVLAQAEAACKTQRDVLGLDGPQRARAVLTMEDLFVAVAVEANDLTAARSHSKWAAEEADRRLPPGDPVRIQAGVREAEVSIRAGDLDAALVRLDRTSEETLRQPEVNARPRVTALMLAAAVRARRGVGAEEAAARMLAAAGRLPAADPLAIGAFDFVVLNFWDTMLARAQKAAQDGDPAGQEAEARLRDDLARFGAFLAVAGVDPGVAALGSLWLARFQWNNQRLAAIDATLEPLSRVIDGPRIPLKSVAAYWNLRGLVETARSQYSRARDDFDKALVANRASNDPQEVKTLNNLGQLLLRQGDYRGADVYLQRAAELYVKTPGLRHDTGRPYTLTNLAKAHEGQGRYEDAESLHLEALGLAKEGADRAVETLCRNNLAIHHYSAGKFAEAFEEMSGVRGQLTRGQGEDLVRLAEADVNLAWIERALGKDESALERFRSALAALRAGPGDGHPRTAEVLSYLARALADLGRVEDARPVLIEALDLREKSMARVLRSALSERDRLALVQELRAHPESPAWPGVLDTYLEVGPRLGIDARDLYARLLKWKGVVSRHAGLRGGDSKDATARALFDRREEVLRRLRSASQAVTGRKDRKKAEENIARLDADADALERDLRRLVPDAAVEGDVTVAEVAAALSPAAALLDVIEISRYRPRRPNEPFTHDRRYVAFLVRPDRPVVSVELGDVGEIDDAVGAAVRGLAAGDPDSAPAAAVLSARVRSPLLAHLGGVETLILSADGHLSRLPMAALPGDRPGTYWVEEISFASVPAAQSLVVRRRPASRMSVGALIVGGVDYGSPAGTSRGADWPPLAGSREEAEAVARAFRAANPGEEVDLLVGAAATEPALRERITRRRFAHLATHGYFRPGREPSGSFATFGPLARFDSGIVLAGANLSAPNDPVDQFLTADEVGTIDLSGLDLIVLSSCEGALGHISEGQGVIGLVGALDRAGAATTVSALWKVEDRATAKLMAAFYRHLWAGADPKGPAQALRLAQTEMIRSAEELETGIPLSRPQFWAAFVVTGDPFPRPRRGR